MMQAAMSNKKCSKCDELKPLSEFNATGRSKQYPAKERAYCKACDHKASTRRILDARRKASQWSWHSRLIDRWYQARGRNYSGTLEEYAEYYELRPLGYHKKSYHVRRRRRADLHCEECGRDSGSKRFCSDACGWRWRYHNDPAYLVWERTRNQHKKWLRGGRASRLIKSLGYTRQQLVKHIERQFQPGMGWGNYGEWHIDHVIPKNLFDYRDPEQVRNCWSLTNLRPLWACENLSRPKDGGDVLV